MTPRTLLLVPLLLFACTTVEPLIQREVVQEPVTAEEAVQDMGHDWESKSVLYARDGSVVPESVTRPAGWGGEAQSQGPISAHQLGGAESGRMYILELYQKVIEERDILSREVTALGSELNRTRQMVADAGSELAAARARIAALEGERQVLIEENLELAGRLTTAQVRRLQAEKILLEQRLEDLREQRQEVAQEETRTP